MPMILENPRGRISDRNRIAALKAAAWVRPKRLGFDKAVRSLLA
jgi:hypothetical protein